MHGLPPKTAFEKKKKDRDRVALSRWLDLHPLFCVSSSSAILPTHSLGLPHHLHKVPLPYVTSVVATQVQDGASVSLPNSEIACQLPVQEQLWDARLSICSWIVVPRKHTTAFIWSSVGGVLLVVDRYRKFLNIIRSNNSGRSGACEQRLGNAWQRFDSVELNAFA